MANASLEAAVRQKIFADPKQENYLCAAGSPHLIKYLSSGKLSQGFAVLSDFSVYCKGSCLVRKKNTPQKKRLVEYRMDISEISDVRCVHTSQNWLLAVCYFFLILAPVLMVLELAVGLGKRWSLSPLLGGLVCLLIAGVFALIYFLRKKTFLRISYTNGSVSLDAGQIPEKETHDFIRQLRQLLADWDAYVEQQSYNQAYNQVYSQAYTRAYSEGYDQGSSEGFSYGFNQGSSQGYSAGFQQARDLPDRD